MSKDNVVVHAVAGGDAGISAEQVAEYLRKNPHFFLEYDDLLVDLTLPHESGKAISLLERQVSILRHRGMEARHKLNDLLENARNNDQLFEVVCNLVLALLEARGVADVSAVTLEQLSNSDNIDACEIILISDGGLTLPASQRTAPADTLKARYSEVFRLRHTYCGPLADEAAAELFPAGAAGIHSTALCPIMAGGEILGLLALGNRHDNYFNTTLDTLFLDFIGKVTGAVLRREARS